MSGAVLDRDALTLVLSPTKSLSIDSGCTATRATVKTKRRGTIVAARWASCGPLARVRLNARIAPGCQQMTGVLRARKAKPHRFAAVASSCGDGVVDGDAGEECDVTGCTAGESCTLCRCAPAGGSTTTTTTTSSSTAPPPSTLTTTTTAISPTTASAPTTTTATTTSTTSSTDPGTPPPDPSTVVPPADDTVPADFAGASRFLVTSGIQTGVAPDALEDGRLTVLRGHVTDRTMAPIPGVVISIAGHPELGQTRTRVDGMFDLLVNGGGALAVRYVKSGYLLVQRTIDVPWRGSVMAPDVVLLAADPAMTGIALPAASMAVLQSSPAQDADGNRRATLLVPAGTTAEMVLPDASVVPLSTMHVHATEFTVGSTGPAAMPGSLPPASGYTYALEYSVDEAVTAGAITVRFSQPVVHYNENFLGFPVGTPVPAGDYDAGQALWMPSDDGRVVEILGVTAGLADLDVDGSGTPASPSALAALGVTDDERAQLAGLYAPGITLWRVPMAHFSPKDWNWPRKPPDDAKPPNDPHPKPDQPDNKPKPDPCKRDGSIIGCYDQTLGEDLPVTGTAFRLHYASDRVPGHTAGSTIDVPVSGVSVPASLVRIDFELTVAGRRFTQTFAPLPNQTAHFVWDGIDAYGRRLQGSQRAHGVVTYVYPAVYGWPSTYGGGAGGRSFGAAASVGVPILGQNRAALQVTIAREFTLSIGAPLDARGIGLGGWSLDVHHVLDPVTGRVLLGSGDEFDTGALDQVDNFAGTGESGSPGGDGGPAVEARFNLPAAAATASDGTLYVTDSGNCLIRSITPDGVIHRVAGTSCGSPAGDDGAALDAGLGGNLLGLAIGPDGSLYVSEFTNGVVRRIGPDGIIRRVAGTGSPGYSGDGGPAEAAQLQSPFGLAVGPDGSLYIADGGNHRIRRVAPDGLIYTVAGNGVPTSTGDGGPAAEATLGYPREMAIARDGTLYFSSSSAIRRITPDGIISTFFPGGGYPSSGDGGPVGNASGSAEGLAIDLDDGSLFFADYNSIRRVGADGIVRKVAGDGSQFCLATGCGDGGPGTAAFVGTVYGLAVGPDGKLYMVDRALSRVRAVIVARATPGLARTIVIPSEDGRLAYAFDSSGRHLQTLDAMTGGVRLQFGYDPDGHLVSVTDADGNVTTIQHDVAGLPTGISAPGGQHTTLAVGPDGYLASIVDPAGDTVTCAYGSGGAIGLLAALTDARGGTHAFTYDAAGRLLVDADPAGGSQTLARMEADDGHSISVTTGLGEVDTYEIHFAANGDTQRTHTDPTGATTTALHRTDGTRTVTYPDGTSVDLTERPDPRWRMLAPVLGAMSIVTPGGTTRTMTATRTATLTMPGNPLTLANETSTLVLNGRTYTSVYDGPTRTQTLTTPSGLERSRTVDASGRTIAMQPDVGGAAAILLDYDAKGRLHSIAHGAQTWTWQYDAKNRPTARTDALGGQTQFGYDAADRRTQTTLPSGGVVTLGRDANGNLQQVTAPGGEAHGLAYDPVDRLTGYTPPGAASWSALFDDDGRVTSVVLPGGVGHTRTYDASGRLATVQGADGTVALGYTGLDPGRVTSLMVTPAVGPSHTLGFEFDGALPTAIESSAPAAARFDLTYGSDGSFRPTTVTFTSDLDMVTTTRTYDVDRRLVTFGPFTITRGGPGGAATAIGDGTLAASFAYDPLGRATSRAIAVGGQGVHALDLAFDAAGRVSQRTDTLGAIPHVTTYGYDADAQLVTVDRDGTLVEEYTYDARGNRLTRRLNGGSIETANYDARDRLLTRGATTYQFDAVGFLAARGADTFAYDSAGELLGAVAGGQAIAYAYDGLGRRIARTDGSGTRRYYYGNPDDDFELTAYRDPAGTLTYCQYDRGRLFALRRGGAWYYVGTDQIGSPLVVVDAAGVVQKSVTYDAFGAASDANPSFELPIGFAAGLADPATGLIRFGLRDYEPASGRWVSPDPILFDGGQANLYTYVGNDPVYLRDPSGTFSIDASAYDGLGVGTKIAVTREGFSACIEAGAGFGTSLEVEPFEDLDGNTFGLKAEASAKFGVVHGKAEGEMNLQTRDFGVGVGECGPEFKGETKVCVGALCGGEGNRKRTVRGIDTDLGGGRDSPVGKATEGIEAKAVVRLCQQYKFFK